MVKHKQSIVVMAKVLVMALLIGVFAAIPSAETFAAANKALRTKVTFNGDKSEEAGENNSYYLGIGYKKASKIKKNTRSTSSPFLTPQVLLISLKSVTSIAISHPTPSFLLFVFFLKAAKLSPNVTGS